MPQLRPFFPAFLHRRRCLPGLALCLSLTTAIPALADNWTPTSAPIKNWGAVACSADGNKIVAAVQNGPIYISTNAGTNWTLTSAPTTHLWSSVASSADGSTLVASGFPGPIYVSTNSGATWAQSSVPSSYYWASVACSADGTKLAAVPYLSSPAPFGGSVGGSSPDGGGDVSAAGVEIEDGIIIPPTLPPGSPREQIYLSDDSGATWRTSDVYGSSPFIFTTLNWTSVAMSADGSRLVVAGVGFNSLNSGLGWLGYFFASSNYGSTWQQIFQPGPAWYTVDSSADGSRLLTAGGFVFRSANEGINWQSPNLPSGNWFSGATSADGTKMLLAGYPGRVLRSTDSGATWRVEDSPTVSWGGVATSADGSRSVAVVQGGGIWVSEPGPGGGGSQVPVGEAVDAPARVWANSSEPVVGGEWIGQTNISHDGVDAAQTDLVMDDLESRLETTVSGPGTLTFWWKVSSEPDFDWLRFHMDGVLQEQISGEVDWQQRSFSVPDGPHVVRWRYLKDLSDTTGQDAAWVDEVQFTPASGFPTITSEPTSQTVWPGANVTLSAVALGSPLLSYQWYFNEPDPISGATQATLALTDVGLADAGRYHVVVSNASGSVPSTVATVALTNNGPVTSVLLLVDSPFPSPYETALTQLGYLFQKYTVAATFNQAVAAADRGETLVVVDAPYNFQDLASVRDFINSGGRALVQAYALVADAALATALQVTLERRFTIPPPVYDWSGSPFFKGMSSPVTLWNAGFNENGQKFHVRAGGYGVAGFAVTAEPGEAAVVIGNAGRTIANGFFLEDMTSPEDAVRFAQNQIEFLSRPATPPSPSVVLFSDDFETGMANWTATSGASTLDWSTSQNQVPGGAGYSALLNSSLDKMYHNLGMELSGWSKATFYIYDDTATRAYGEVRSYVEAGYSPSATLQNVYAIGKYNGVTMVGETFEGTKYQGRIAFGPGANGWFNLNTPGAPSRSTGWHRFDIVRMADGVTYNFYVDGILGRSITGVTDFPWDCATIGSVAAGSSVGDAYFDGVEIAILSEPGTPMVPLNIQWINYAVVLTWSNLTFTLQSAPTVNGVYTNVPGATSPHTNAISGPQQFFRLQAN